MSAHSFSQQEVQAYGIRDFSRIYAVSESTARRMIEANTIATVRIGGRRLIVAKSAHAWFQRLLSEQGVAA